MELTPHSILQRYSGPLPLLATTKGTAKSINISAPVHISKELSLTKSRGAVFNCVFSAAPVQLRHTVFRRGSDFSQSGDEVSCRRF
jgi:hypothetical protein